MISYVKETKGVVVLFYFFLGKRRCAVSEVANYKIGAGHSAEASGDLVSLVKSHKLAVTLPCACACAALVPSSNPPTLVVHKTRFLHSLLVKSMPFSDKGPFIYQYNHTHIFSTFWPPPPRVFPIFSTLIPLSWRLRVISVPCHFSSVLDTSLSFILCGPTAQRRVGSRDKLPLSRGDSEETYSRWLISGDTGLW